MIPWTCCWSHCFSTIELASGYWRVEVAKEDQEKTYINVFRLDSRQWFVKLYLRNLRGEMENSNPLG